jgi:hypothetical protein
MLAPQVAKEKQSQTGRHLALAERPPTVANEYKSVSWRWATLPCAVRRRTPRNAHMVVVRKEWLRGKVSHDKRTAKKTRIRKV